MENFYLPTCVAGGVLGVGRDLSRRKRIETDLLRFHAEMTAILESTNDLIWSVDGDFAKRLRAVLDTRQG